jgi:hypothetical protein
MRSWLGYFSLMGAGVAFQFSMSVYFLSNGPSPLFWLSVALNLLFLLWALHFLFPMPVRNYDPTAPNSASIPKSTDVLLEFDENSGTSDFSDSVRGPGTLFSAELQAYQKIRKIDVRASKDSKRHRNN